MIPNLFSKLKVPEKLPENMQEAVEQLKACKDKKECMQKAYELMKEKTRGCHTFQRVHLLFAKDINKLWDNNPIHCHNLSYVLRILLIKSGFFKEEDIKQKLCTVNFIGIHQYLKVKVDENKSINLDPWGASNKIAFGEYATGWHFEL